jgi:hypothetical protein
MLNLSTHFSLLYYSQLILKIKNDCFQRGGSGKGKDSESENRLKLFWENGYFFNQENLQSKPDDLAAHFSIYSRTLKQKIEETVIPEDSNLVPNEINTKKRSEAFIIQNSKTSTFS